MGESHFNIEAVTTVTKRFDISITEDQVLAIVGKYLRENGHPLVKDSDLNLPNLYEGSKATIRLHYEVREK